MYQKSSGIVLKSIQLTIYIKLITEKIEYALKNADRPEFVSLFQYYKIGTDIVYRLNTPN